MENKFRYRIEGFGGFQYYALEEIEEGVLELNGDYDIYSRDNFTGLKDKNGTEIYGGDMVECQGNIYEIFFMDGIFYAKYNKLQHQLPLYSLPIKEITGNIYEDLLTKN